MASKILVMGWRLEARYFNTKLNGVELSTEINFVW